MPTFAADGVNIHYEVTGSGLPLVLSHEFAGDGASWEPQVNFFSRRYQVVTYSARGYLPSDVPEDPAAYSQDRSTEDLRCLMDHLGIEQAYIGGLSMGGSVTVSFAIAHPERCRALIVAAAGAGADNREQMLASWKVGVETMLNQGMGKFAERYANGPERVQFKRKDPSGWQKFFDGLSSHSALGSALTFQGVQMKRQTIYQLEEDLKRIEIPALVLTGDEDAPCVGPAVFMKECLSRSGLAVFPQSGHTINLEEPALFNRTVLDFLTAVEAGSWVQRGG